MKFPQALDSEFKRVARTEEIPMEELVAEVARLTNKSTREIYNWRSGRWSLKVELIPALCVRFGSRALVEALDRDCGHVAVEVPESFDLSRAVSTTVREDLGYYEEFLKAFESDGVDPSELVRLRELMERVVGNAHHFLEIAAADCERRQAQRSHQPMLIDRSNQ
jgi:hypothetical protein